MRARGGMGARGAATGPRLQSHAGLVDPGEDALVAALRELKEETGFSATVQDATLVPFPVHNDPGLTGSATACVSRRRARSPLALP